MVCAVECRIHARRERRDSLLDSGSFATNTAIKTASDLDLRFVTKSIPNKDQIKYVMEYIKYNWRGHVSAQGMKFGYIDSGLSNESPSDEPSIKIY